MKINNKIIGYCGLCSFGVPLDKRYITRVYSRGEEGRFYFFVSYICPKCGAMTDLVYPTSEDPKLFQEWLNLYGEKVERWKPKDERKKHEK